MFSEAFELYPYAMGAEELSYIMGLTSAELSMCDVDVQRRLKDRPLGILMERMNDPWPSLSPSAVDYFGGRKPLHYYEREFFAPVRISAVRNGTRIKFVVSNEMRIDYIGVFCYVLMNNMNEPIFRDSFPIRARAASNLEIHNIDVGSLISGHEDEYYLLYSVADKCNEVSKGTLLFTNIKRYRFTEPKIDLAISGTGMEFTATVSAEQFVKGVELTFDGEDITVDKNYFDITGKAPVRVRLTSKRVTTVEKLNRIVKLRTVYNLGRGE
jgi:beta-mannosidase